MEKVQKIVDVNPTISFENGILLIKNTAFNTENDDDMKFHEELQKQLFL